MADSPNETFYSAQSVTWRRVTNLHRSLGPRAIKSASPLILSAGVQFTVFNALFGPRSIDRIIGVNLRFGGVPGAATLTLADLASGFVWQVQASGHLGNYSINIETLETNANIIVSSSVGVTAAMNAQVSLYNFEIPTEAIGHSG